MIKSVAPKILALSILSVLFGCAVTAVLIAVFRDVPITSSLSPDLFDEWRYAFRPERETFFYRIFVMSGIVVQFFLVLFLLPGMKGQGSSPAVLGKADWRWQDILILLGIPCFIYVPDVNLVLSRVGDYYYHIDSFFTAPGWSVISNLRLNVDTIAWYGVTIPTLTAKILSSVGSFNYPGVIMWTIVVSCLYFCAFYLFLRVWLRSILAALAGLVAFIGFQVFHSGLFPIAWQFPSATAMRFVWDIPALLLILMHLRQGKALHLWIAALFVGCSLAWSTDVGVYLFLALGFYCVMTLIRRGLGQWKNSGDLGAALSIPPVAAFFILWVIQGNSIFQAQYWTNAFELASFFVQGMGALPMTEALASGRWVAFSVGFAIPIAYLFCLLYVTTLCVLRRTAWENIFISVLCIYGLALYHYYIVRSAPTSYATVCFPIVAIGSMACKRIALTAGQRGGIVWGVVFVALASFLFFNPLVKDYPGIWNPKARSRSIHVEPMDFPEDVALIKRLTRPDERVPLMSSFQVKMLMDAERKPYFYYFPISQSSQMEILQFRSVHIHTRAGMSKTLTALETDKPPVIFVELMLVSGRLPQVYYQNFQTLNILIKYILSNYDAIDHGKYLVALRRKGN